MSLPVLKLRKTFFALAICTFSVSAFASDEAKFLDGVIKERPANKKVFPDVRCNVEQAKDNLQNWLIQNPRPTYDGDNPWRVIPVIMDSLRGTIIEISRENPSVQLSIVRIVIRSICGNNANFSLNEVYAEGARPVTAEDLKKEYLQVNLRNYKLTGEHLMISLRGPDAPKQADDDKKTKKVETSENLVILSDGFEDIKDPSSKLKSVPKVIDWFWAKKP